jgi:hypothetical protein
MNKRKLLILGAAGIAIAILTFAVIDRNDDPVTKLSAVTTNPLAGFDNPGPGATTDGAPSGEEFLSPNATPSPYDARIMSNDAAEADPFTNSSGGTGGSTSAGGVGGTAATGGSLPAVQVLDRKIVRNATLDVEVDDVPATVRSVESSAIAAGGFVSSSNVYVETPPDPEPAAEGQPQPTPAPDRQRANVQVRVPSESYTAVMSDLRALGDVQSESSTTSEVTEQYTDLEARLRNLQATEQQYLDLLGKAEAIPDIITVQDRLNSVRLEIEQVQGQLKLLDDLTDLATIDVNIALPPVVVEIQPVETEPGWAQEAWDNAWEKSQQVLEAMGTVAITAGVVLVWILVPAILLGMAWRVVTAIGRRGSTA